VRLEQVVSNLLTNAAKFSPAYTPIEVTVQWVSADCVAVSVRDFGPGIPPEQQAHLFERFSHTDERKGGGLGLGLYISQQIALLHNGALRFESPPDGGTRLVLTLPCKSGD
jgi:signal transduction histidine kinase